MEPQEHFVCFASEDVAQRVTDIIDIHFDAYNSIWIDWTNSKFYS